MAKKVSNNKKTKTKKCANCKKLRYEIMRLRDQCKDLREAFNDLKEEFDGYKHFVRSVNE